MSIASIVRAFAIAVVVLNAALPGSAALAADPAVVVVPAPPAAVVETPVVTSGDALQFVPAQFPAVEAAPSDLAAPAAVDTAVAAPMTKDADAIIAAGQDMAIQGAASGDRLMVRAGRRMIRDGALLKRAQQLER